VPVVLPLTHHRRLPRVLPHRHSCQQTMRGTCRSQLTDQTSTNEDDVTPICLTYREDSLGRVAIRYGVSSCGSMRRAPRPPRAPSSSPRGPSDAEETSVSAIVAPGRNIQWPRRRVMHDALAYSWRPSAVVEDRAQLVSCTVDVRLCTGN